MHKILATRRISVNRYTPPLHGAISEISIEQVLFQDDEGYKTYEAERAITIHGGDWKRQISEPIPATKQELKEAGIG